MFFLLTSSFMTDVPFMACTMMALLCYVRAESRGHLHLVWWAGFWGLMALLIREIGVITPVAGLPLLLRSERDVASLPRRHVILALAATWIVMALSWLALTSILEPTSEMTMLRDRLSYLLLVSAIGYLVANLNMLTTIAFHALPALLAMASTRNLWRPGRLLLMAAAVAVILLAAVGEIPQPLRLGGIWSLRELGLARALVRGQPVSDLPVGIATVLRGAGLLALALGLAALVPHFRWRRGVLVEGMSGAGSSMAPASSGPARPSCLSALLRSSYTFALSRGRERPMVHPRSLLDARALRVRCSRAWPRRDSGPCARACVERRPLFAATALVGTRDTLRFNEALRDGSQPWSIAVCLDRTSTPVIPEWLDALRHPRTWRKDRTPAAMSRGCRRSGRHRTCSRPLRWTTTSSNARSPGTIYGGPSGSTIRAQTQVISPTAAWRLGADNPIPAPESYAAGSHILWPKARIDAQILERAIEPVDMLLHLEQAVAEAAGHVEPAVAVDPHRNRETVCGPRSRA